MNYAISAIKRSPSELKSRIEMTQERVSKFVDQLKLSNQQNRENILEKSEQRFRDLWDNIKSPNICVIEVPEEEVTEYGREKYI